MFTSNMIVSNVVCLFEWLSTSVSKGVVYIYYREDIRNLKLVEAYKDKVGLECHNQERRPEVRMSRSQDGLKARRPDGQKSEVQKFDVQKTKGQKSEVLKSED